MHTLISSKCIALISYLLVSLSSILLPIVFASVIKLNLVCHKNRIFRIDIVDRHKNSHHWKRTFCSLFDSFCKWVLTLALFHYNFTGLLCVIRILSGADWNPTIDYRNKQTWWRNVWPHLDEFRLIALTTHNRIQPKTKQFVFHALPSILSTIIHFQLFVQIWLEKVIRNVRYFSSYFSMSNF